MDDKHGFALMEEKLLSWNDMELFRRHHAKSDWTYANLKKFLVGGERRLRRVLLPRPKKNAISGRELAIEMV